MSKNKTANGFSNELLDKYKTEEGINILQLLRDDFFGAIQLLWNSGFKTSALKLLFSAIDSIAYIAYGDRRGSFQIWVKKYLGLKNLGVTPDEIWELRNGLLHMTQNESRKVKKRKARRIIHYFGNPILHDKSDKKEAFLNVDSFLAESLNGISKFSEQVKSNPNRLTRFARRYSAIFSDKRLLAVKRVSHKSTPS